MENKKIIIVGTVLPAKIRGKQAGVVVGGLRAADIDGLGACVIAEIRLLAPLDGSEFVDIIFRGSDFVRAAASGGEYPPYRIPLPGDLVRIEFAKKRLKWREYGEYKKASIIVNSPAAVEIRRQSTQTVAEILGGGEPPPTPTSKRKKRV